MSADLEQQLRAVGRRHDELAPPVSVDEVVRRTTDVPRLAASLAPDFGIDFDDDELGMRRRGRLGLLTVAAVLVATLVGGLFVIGRSTESPSTAESSLPGTDPSNVANSGSASTVVVPQPVRVDATVVPLSNGLARPDVYPVIGGAAFTDVFAMYQQPPDALVTGVVALVGQLADDRLTGGIQIATFTEPAIARSVEDADETISIDGVDVFLFTIEGDDDFENVVVPGEVSVSLTGRDVVEFLEAAGTDVVDVDPAGRFVIDEERLPAGYSVVIEPQDSQADAVSASTIAQLAASDGPSVSVQLEHPMLGLQFEDDLRRTMVDGVSGWSSPSPGGVTLHWPVSPTTWATVRARDAAGEVLTLDEAVEFASSVEFVDEATWRGTYGVPEPGVGDASDAIAIDTGVTDGIGAEMVVQADGELVGRVSSVTADGGVVQLASDPSFEVGATLAPEEGGVLSEGCRVRGGADHVGFVCDDPFDDRVRPGVGVVASGNTQIPAGTGLGTITGITEIAGEQVALLDVLSDLPVTGDVVSVVVPGG